MSPQCHAWPWCQLSPQTLTLVVQQEESCGLGEVLQNSYLDAVSQGGVCVTGPVCRGADIDVCPPGKVPDGGISLADSARRTPRWSAGHGEVKQCQINALALGDRDAVGAGGSPSAVRRRHCTCDISGVGGEEGLPLGRTGVGCVVSHCKEK